MNKRFKYLLQHRVSGKKRDTAQLAAQLAPLEELIKNKGQTQEKPVDATGQTDSIVVDKNSLKLPKEMLEESNQGKNIWRLEPVAVVILVVALAFIAFIAWQISLMPPE